jgi:signal transduction histidine kinase/CheY-like chemotaxis protein
LLRLKPYYIQVQAWRWLAIAAAIVPLWAAIGLTLWHDRALAEQGAVKDTANLARTFEESITRTVEAVDQTLLFLRDEYQEHQGSFLQQTWPENHSFLNDLHVQISMAGRDGRAIWTNLGPVDPAIDVSDREHFQVQKASKDDALFISRPLIGRQSNKWSIQFVRKLLAPDGSFDGIAVVSLDPNYLSRFYGSIAVGNGTIILASTGGTILARAPVSASLIGHQLPAGTETRLLKGPPNGSFRTISDIDHVERIVSFRRLDGYPLVVAVGLAIKDVFAVYQRNKRLYVAAGVILSAGIIVAGLAMQRQQRLLIDSRHTLAVTLENMSQGIAMIRADGSVPVVNRRAIELLGLPPELMTGRVMLRDVVEWQLANREFGDEATLDPALARLLREKGSHLYDYVYERTRPNGTVLEVRSQTLPDGGVVCTYTDITERKANEAALAEAQVRAAHAERMHALGQLAGGIAHDFNNILQAVQGAASLIDRRAAGDAETIKRFARMILEATGRGASITRRLLAFARRGELRAEPVEPKALLHDLRDVLSHTLGAAISVTVDIAGDLPAVLADKGQLETALVNLATNSRDAMPNGGTLRFDGAAEMVVEGGVHPAELRPGRYVRLTISDDGMGMDRTMLARASEPFFTTKPIGQGTGLGLSMVKGFTEQSGGGMTIDSAPGHGTVVALWLPAVDQAAITPPDRNLVPARIPADRPRRVMLVDDEAMVRDTLAAGLEDAGYAVIARESGSEALALLRSGEAVDVLVSDLSMPGMDGLTVIMEAQRIRPGLPAVLLTGYAGHGAQLAVGRALERSFALVRKPVQAGQLSDRIEALLAVAPV